MSEAQTIIEQNKIQNYKTQTIKYHANIFIVLLWKCILF